MREKLIWIILVVIAICLTPLPGVKSFVRLKRNYLTFGHNYNHQKSKTIEQLSRVADVIILKRCHKANALLDYFYEYASQISHIFINNCNLICFPEFPLCTGLITICVANNKIDNVKLNTIELQTLEMLNLSGNEIKELPSELGELVNLKGLIVNSNQLSTLPHTIGNLKSLLSIQACDNLITHIPDEIKKCLYLRILRLSKNKLRILPNNLTNITNLRVLELNENEFLGIPKQIFDIETLIEFSFAANNVSGKIPVDLCQLKELRVLDLSKNNFTAIPKELKNLTHLRYINLRGNPIEGDLDQTIAFGKGFQELRLEGCGAKLIPEDIGNSKSLKIVNLSFNSLSEFPVTFGNLEELRALFLTNNKLTSIPSWFANFKKMTTLELAGNELESLPESFTDLKVSLRQINLSSNKFADIPDCILKQDQNLVYLYMENNPLTRVSEKIGNLSNLTHLSLARCSELSTLPDEFGKLESLYILDLSKTPLNTLPNTLMNLKELTYLNLSHTKFYRFPKVVCFLDKLKVLLYNQEFGQPLNCIPDPKIWLHKTYVYEPDEKYYQLSSLANEQNETDGFNFSKLTHHLMDYTLDQALLEDKEYDQEKSLVENNNPQLIIAPHMNEEGLPFLIGRLKELIHLSVSHNNLRYLPDVFQEFPKFKSLDVSFNKIAKLPPHFHNCRGLTTLIVNNNKLFELNNSFLGLTKLQTVNFKDNEFVLPPKIICESGHLPSIRIFLENYAQFEMDLLLSMIQKVSEVLPESAVENLFLKLGMSDLVLKDLMEHHQLLPVSSTTLTGLKYLSNTYMTSNVATNVDIRTSSIDIESRSIFSASKKSEIGFKPWVPDQPFDGKLLTVNSLMLKLRSMGLLDIHKELEKIWNKAIKL